MATINGFIKTEAAYQDALDKIDSFFANMPKVGTVRGDQFELLSFLVSKYEDERFHIPDADPVDLIRFAIEDMGRSQAELSTLLGSRGRASEVLSRKRRLTLDNIRAISEAWKLPLGALAVPYELHQSAA